MTWIRLEYGFDSITRPLIRRKSRQELGAGHSTGEVDHEQQMSFESGQLVGR